MEIAIKTTEMKKLWKWMVMTAVPHCDYSMAVNCTLEKGLLFSRSVVFDSL